MNKMLLVIPFLLAMSSQMLSTNALHTAPHVYSSSPSLKLSSISTHATGERYTQLISSILSNANKPFTNSYSSSLNFWNRASDNLYVAAKTYNTNNKSLLFVEPHQKIQLLVTSNGGTRYNKGVTWYTDSSNSSVTTDNSGHRFYFSASSPGIYTVQAKTGSSFSVPLVITVGITKLGYINQTGNSNSFGIRPMLPGLKPVSSWSNGRNVAYMVYNPINNWIPVSGSVTSDSITNITIVLNSINTYQSWSYSIPVGKNKHFSAMVLSPISGNITGTLYTKYISDLNLPSGSKPIDTPYQVSYTISGDKKLSSQQAGLLASAKMNFNLDPNIRAVAQSLYQNSPNTETAIEAINNFVGEYVAYNMSELKPAKYKFQDSQIVMSKAEGVCQDYAELEASMLKSVGIPADTIIGSVSTYPNEPDSHEWLKAWDGKEWIVADPTWTGTDEPVVSNISNRYFTNTLAMQLTHTADPSKVGTAF